MKMNENLKNNYKIFHFISILFLFSIVIFNTCKISKNLYQSNLRPLSSYSPADIKLYFFLNNACDICLNKRVWLREFNNSHPELQYIEIEVYSGDPQKDDFARNYFSTFPKSLIGVPNPSVVIDINNSCRIFISSNYLELEIVNQVYENILNNNYNETCRNIPANMNGWIIYGEYNILLSFITGIFSGLSPCILLITIVLSGSFLSFQEKHKFFLVVIGFIVGILSAYLLIGILFSIFYDYASLILNNFTLKIIIGIPLILLGLWYMIDAWNKKSRLFSTPEKFKNLFKKLANKQNLLSAILLGLLFTILKSPCVAAILLSLLFNILNNYFNKNLIILNIMVFSIGVIIPIIIIALILKLSMKFEKFNEKREKIRPFLRFISGLIIIILIIASLF